MWWPGDSDEEGELLAGMMSPPAGYSSAEEAVSYATPQPASIQVHSLLCPPTEKVGQDPLIVAASSSPHSCCGSSFRGRAAVSTEDTCCCLNSGCKNRKKVKEGCKHSVNVVACCAQSSTWSSHALGKHNLTCISCKAITRTVQLHLLSQQSCNVVTFAYRRHWSTWNNPQTSVPKLLQTNKLLMAHNSCVRIAFAHI